MSSTLPSDEVAEDYKASLEDLALNSRYEISNLTIIAKENTEHAMAISRVLENHIRKVGSILVFRWSGAYSSSTCDVHWLYICSLSSHVIDA